MDEEPFREWLIKEMEKRGWTQANLSKAAGVPRGTINNILKGTRNPGSQVLVAIANALNLSPVTLLRKAGILPPSESEEVEFSDWQYILNKLSLDDQEELRKIAEMKFERRKKEQSLKALKAKKAER